jgi:hypothetical protein
MEHDQEGVRAFTARPLPPAMELLRTSQEIAERGKGHSAYPWIARHLPVLYDALWAPDTDGERRGWARERLQYFAVVEAEAFWKARTRNRASSRSEATWNDWGRYLTMVAWVAAYGAAARYVRKETPPLNAALDIMQAIKDDLYLFWIEKLGPRILNAQKRRDDRSALDEAGLIWVLKQSWALGAETQEDRTIVAAVGVVCPEALVKYRISPAQAVAVYEALREQHGIDVKSPEACRKRFARICERVKREAPRITQIAEAIRTIPTE